MYVDVCSLCSLFGFSSVPFSISAFKVVYATRFRCFQSRSHKSRFQFNHRNRRMAKSATANYLQLAPAANFHHVIHYSRWYYNYLAVLLFNVHVNFMQKEPFFCLRRSTEILWNHNKFSFNHNYFAVPLVASYSFSIPISLPSSLEPHSIVWRIFKLFTKRVHCLICRYFNRQQF